MPVWNRISKLNLTIAFWDQLNDCVNPVFLTSCWHGSSGLNKSITHNLPPVAKSDCESSRNSNQGEISLWNMPQIPSAPPAISLVGIFEVWTHRRRAHGCHWTVFNLKDEHFRMSVVKHKSLFICFSLHWICLLHAQNLWVRNKDFYEWKSPLVKRKMVLSKYFISVCVDDRKLQCWGGLWTG